MEEVLEKNNLFFYLLERLIHLYFAKDLILRLKFSPHLIFLLFFLVEGLTGYPIIDAGMRELYSTGWMHNRVRMIVGSFLVKHLLLRMRLKYLSNFR